MTKVSRIDRLFNALYNGEALTSRQITRRFRLKNARAAISTLRGEGLKISYNDTRSNTKRYLQKYRVQENG